MPVLLLLFLWLACLPEPGKDWPEPPWDAGPWLAVVLSAMTVGISALSAGLVSRRTRLALAAGAQAREDVVMRYERSRSRHQLLLFGLYLLALLVFGWGNAVGRFWRVGDRLLPLPELVVLAPFLVSLLLSWACFYGAERALWATGLLDDGLANALPEREAAVETVATFTTVPHATYGVPDSLTSRRDYVLFHLRQTLALLFLPVGLILAIKEFTRLIPEEALPQWERVFHVAGALAVLAAFAAMPWILRLVLGLTPLPDGPLARRLLAMTQRLGFRCGGLLLWNTGRDMANAMVIGILPWPRYVIFTDRLLEELTPEEVEAVLGHELGHVRHRHILYYLGFLLATFAIMVLAAWRFGPQRAAAEPVPPPTAQVEPAEPELDPAPRESAATSLAGYLTLHNHSYVKLIPGIVTMLAYIFVVFGYVSRRCERQADVFGCRAVSCSRPDCTDHADDEPTGAGGQLCPTGLRTFIRALEKVARMNGLNRERPGFLQSWQHSTIARRVEFLQQLLHEPVAEHTFQRRVLLVKCGLMGVLGLVMAALVLV
jgi:Zn-dependent protease with chaperone function